MKNIFVRNLASETSPDEISVLFEAYGQVLHVNIMGDRATAHSRGFAFVEMRNDKDAKRAVSELNGTTLGGKTLQVEEGRPSLERGRRRGIASTWGGST
ncbi:MAG TPA: RNA-binding protein [Terriglobales bacterium]|nr:RNA-binding protein [Terriglobales bacterium]